MAQWLKLKPHGVVKRAQSNRPEFKSHTCHFLCDFDSYSPSLNLFPPQKEANLTSQSKGQDSLM